MSYMYNKYELYRMKGINNVFMRYFKYSDKVVRPSYASFPCGNRNGINARLRVMPLIFTFSVLVLNAISYPLLS